MCSMVCQRVSRFRRSSQSKVLTEAESAYLAGIVDGEGSIMLLGRDSGSVGVSMTVTNTYAPLLDWILDLTGVGGLFRSVKYAEHHKAGGYWRSNGDGAVSVLRQIRPYLLVKSAQTDLALQHHEWLRDPARKADRSWQQANRLTMKELNKRGVAVPE